MCWSCGGILEFSHNQVESEEPALGPTAAWVNHRETAHMNILPCVLCPCSTGHCVSGSQEDSLTLQCSYIV